MTISFVTFNIGVAGAAYATVLGQIVSMILAMLFHYWLNKDINGSLKYIRPNLNLTKSIYVIGVSASLMQILLSVMMAGMNAILASANYDFTILVGAFGIYYKIQQIALFSCFVLSNTIITLLSFNYGMKDKNRSSDCIKHGVIDTLIESFIIMIIFEIIAKPLSELFSLSGESTSSLIAVCEKATSIASLGYILWDFQLQFKVFYQRYAML